jgi:hypothetical protein
MDEETEISPELVLEAELSSDPDSDELTINEEMLVPIVEIKEDLETNWKLKRRRNRVKPLKRSLNRLENHYLLSNRKVK